MNTRFITENMTIYKIRKQKKNKTKVNTIICNIQIRYTNKMFIVAFTYRVISLHYLHTGYLTTLITYRLSHYIIYIQVISLHYLHTGYLTTLSTYRLSHYIIYIQVVTLHYLHTGYLTTLFGRRRLFPNINHSNFHIRTQCERQAVNFCVQGKSAYRSFNHNSTNGFNRIQI